MYKHAWIFSFGFLLVAACGPSVSSGDDDDDTDGGVGDPCSPGATRCEGNTRLECGPEGTFVVAEECPNACDATLGCVFCEPGTGTCDASGAMLCRPDGSGYDEIECDPLQGLSCNVDSGLCEGACSAAALGRAYIGCEYYPTVTGNEVDNAFTYAVAISNTAGVPANIHIEGGALTAPMTLEVPPATVQVQVLPWVPQLKACTNGGGAIECGAPMESSAMVAKGAYHLRSDRPVTVYQFNPLDYTVAGGCVGGQAGCSYTNDASLLLPVNAWTGSYVAASYPPWPGPLGNWPNFLTISASEDGTEVTVVPRGAIDAGTGVTAMPASTPSTITLNAGDAVQLFSTTGDLTGSVIDADKPVQVIGGHYCTQVPNGITACDHIEESIFPVETLDVEYVVTSPAVPTLPNGKVRVVRIVATQANTTLTYDPPQAGAPATIAQAGGMAEIVGTRADFKITANHKVVVAQYMEGQEAEGGTGDPAMSLAVPVGQYRSSYQFHAPQNYVTLYVNVIAPMDATVMLDGTPLAGFTPIGGTGYGILKYELAKNGTGNYVISSGEPFGIDVYGYGDWTSFYYPGGLDLTEIPIE